VNCNVIVISWNAGTIPNIFIFRTFDRTNLCTGRQRGWKKIGRVREKNEREILSERVKEITSEATEREEKRIKKRKRGRRKREKCRDFMCYVCDKPMKNRTKNLCLFYCHKQPCRQEFTGVSAQNFCIPLLFLLNV